MVFRVLSISNGSLDIQVQELWSQQILFIQALASVSIVTISAF